MMTTYLDPETAEYRSLPYLPPLRRLAWVALALFCFSTAGTLLNLRSWRLDGVTILWPSNGLLLGMLLTTPRRQWPAYLAVGFGIDLGINMALTFALPSSSYLAFCNMLEAGLAAQLMYRTISPNPDLTQRKQFLSLLSYGVVLAPAVASLLAQLNRSGAQAMPMINAFRHWFAADALGIAVITPLYLSYTARDRFPGRSRLEIAGLLALLSAVAVAVFWQTRVPVLFLVLPVLLALGVRLRLVGSALGLLIVSIIGGFFTIAGYGPIALMRTNSITTRTVMLQFFVATSMLVLYVVEVVTAERERLQSNLVDSETRFRLLAEASNDIIVLSDLAGTRHYVSPAVRSMLGWEPEELLGHNYHQIVHPDDLDAMRSLITSCRSGNPAGTLIYRCFKKDGGFLWLEANIRLYRDSVTGAPSGFVNVVRDVSKRKATEDELNLQVRQAQDLAMVDGLTGIANRRHFDETIDREWKRTMRDGGELSLLMIDVDHFKPYNDLYGHIMGDECLRAIAETTQSVIHRATDLFARYGGEEFAVVLPSTDVYGAHMVAEQIRAAVERRGLSHPANPHGVVTVSVGCATQGLSFDSTPISLLKAADDALYRAKSYGRNRVEIAEPMRIEV
ncbi:diguanylate cyclase [Granulicella sp. L60]|uniref:sensor domain-containing diguanylate cyclase n=1 Tax=Granulicella sp. L60 TaxID=1641866 RepID=UPI00131DB5EB|nr:diguanylate cyclase [Granulicella sp. L60]